jgi:hypothetical protein
MRKRSVNCLIPFDGYSSNEKLAVMTVRSRESLPRGAVVAITSCADGFHTPTHFAQDVEPTEGIS